MTQLKYLEMGGRASFKRRRDYVAKKIEAGKDVMINALAQSPL